MSQAIIARMIKTAPTGHKAKILDRIIAAVEGGICPEFEMEGDTLKVLVDSDMVEEQECCEWAQMDARQS